MINPEATNMLHEIYQCILEAPIQLRSSICEECNWSLPTFYRKMKAADKVGNPALSNAEKEGVIRKAKIVAQEIYDFIGKYK